MTRILVASDAWSPQINGVVRTLETVIGHLRSEAHDVLVLSPDRFRTVPMPTYPEIRLAIDAPWRAPRLVEAFRPEAIHIATEGPIGFAVRRHCRMRDLPFTTSFHSRFPEYIHARTRLPLGWSYAALRRFHGAAVRTMVATPSLEADLAARGFRNLVRWSRGVDTALFNGADPASIAGERPFFLYVGRVAIEKNIRAFLEADLPGTKLVIGDGPQRPELERAFPTVRFLGAKVARDLARHYAAADVFVFPSRTDTFGLVLLEALASGLPVAAYPVTGPRDVLAGSDAGVLDEDLGQAARRALAVPRDRCRAHALTYSWAASASQFSNNLARITRPARHGDVAGAPVEPRAAASERPSP